MSNSKAVFHDPVSPSERYAKEVEEGAEHPISYAGESRGGTWKAERDSASRTDAQMEKGEQAGKKASDARSKKDEDYQPSS